MARPDSWMPIYWGDYWADTGGLSAIQHGAYLNLIGRYWRDGGLPNDDGFLQRASTMSEKEWKANKSIILRFFTVNGDRLAHRRIDRELVKAQTAYEKRRLAAEKTNANRRGDRSTNRNGKRSGDRIANRDADRHATHNSQSFTDVKDNSLLQSGAVAPLGPDDPTIDLKTKIFGPALSWLMNATKKTEPQCRTLLGRWCSKRGDGPTLEALQAASRNAPLDPIPYIEKVLKNGPNNRKPSVIDTAADHLNALARIAGTQPMDDGPTAAENVEPLQIGNANSSNESGAFAHNTEGLRGSNRQTGEVCDGVRSARGGREVSAGNLPRDAGQSAVRSAPNRSQSDDKIIHLGQPNAVASGDNLASFCRPIEARIVPSETRNGADEMEPIPAFLQRTVSA